MSAGTTLFAQVLGSLPWKAFRRVLARHEGNRGARAVLRRAVPGAGVRAAAEKSQVRVAVSACGWSPSAKSASAWRSRSTLFSRPCRSPCSKKAQLNQGLSENPLTTEPMAIPTN